MKIIKHLLLVLPFAFVAGTLNAQTIKVKRESLYGSKINVPVKIEVEERNGYVFYAHNDSYYDYTVHLEITDIVNLTPTKVDQSFRVRPGKNRLVQLKIQDGSRRPSYRFNYTYSIGVKRGKPDIDFPYLIPVKAPFEIKTSNTEEKDILPNQFSMQQGDTVYAARRGKIVATPGMFDGMDRISQNNAIEIQHPDGTLMIYENIDPESGLVKAGDEVLPGQAIGLLDELGLLNIILYKSTGDGYLEAMYIHYYTDDQHVETFSEKLQNTPVKHPQDIVTKEFSRKELKQLKK
ncbi:MAG: M23 family metallopeptidase [Bacteroidales bacterium]|nr:M23 family metallopeptidase [Bacteroidales bacterium]MDT8432202.1 M23 family metallopeptidase [Bacteroidales bacterium]